MQFVRRGIAGPDTPGAPAASRAVPSGRRDQAGTRKFGLSLRKTDYSVMIRGDARRLVAAVGDTAVLNRVGAFAYL